MGMDTKQCSRCGETKQLDAFSADTRYLGGRKGQCRACINEIKRERRGRPRDSKWDAEGRVCNDCGRYLPWSSYGVNARAATGYNYRCRKCVSVRTKAYKDSRSEEKKAQDSIARQLWRQVNRDSGVLSEARRRAAVRFTVTRRDLRRLMDRQRGICNVCNETLKVPQVDHIIPLARGGTHGIGNLQYLCALCNQRKNKRVMTEMRKGGGW